jgi:hypothetical protein
MATPPGAEALTFETTAPTHQGQKEALIRATFAIAPARYYLILHRYLDTQEALEQDPVTTNRLRRLRDVRTAARAARTTAHTR